MKLLAKIIAFLLLANQVSSDDFEDFKAHVLDEIKTLKEDNAKKDQEIAALKSGREEVVTAIQNNIINIEANLDDLTKLNNKETKFNETLKDLKDEMEDISNIFSRSIILLYAKINETLEGFRAEIEDVAQDNVENGLEALENRIEENYNEINKHLGNAEENFSEQLKNLDVVGKNEEFDQDVNSAEGN